MFSHFYVFVFRTEYEISGDTVFLFFCFEEFNPYHKTQRKSKLSLLQSNYLHPIYLVEQNLKPIFLIKKIWRNALALKSKKGQGIFGETFTLTLSSSTVFLLQNRVSNFFQFFSLGCFYQISWRNEVDFMDMMYISQKKSAEDWNLKKLRYDFVDEEALITATLISFWHWKTYVPFCLRKKRPENQLWVVTAI